MTKVYHRLGGRSDWQTPSWLIRQLDREFRFTLDVAAEAHNACCSRFFTPEQDGLSQNWEGVCWMNPPYGRDLAAWVRKAVVSARTGATVVCLLPARTDTSWWHECVLPYGEIRYIRGRIQFGDSRGPRAPFPSVIVVFRPLTTARAVPQSLFASGAHS